MKILIGADIVPTQSNKNAFISGDVDRIVDRKLLELLKNCDCRIFNLETPLADKKTPIKKCGPNLAASTTCINGIKALGVDAFTLANNHIMDHGVQGLESTMGVLAGNKIDFFGAGKNISDARRPYIIEKDGIKVGIYACVEHEFSIADENEPGANPFDPFESLDHISALKEQCDYVVVLYHGGKEYYRYPSPYLQKACRKMCDKGADVVICQHSHCIGCEEKYNSSTVVYGQGNFIFDAADDEFWNSALLVELIIEDKLDVNYISLEKKGGIVKLSGDESIVDNFKERSKAINVVGFIEKEYSEFAEKMLKGYIRTFCGESLLFRILNKLCGHRLKKSIGEQRRLAVINFIECEAHRELVLKGLKSENERR